MTYQSGQFKKPEDIPEGSFLHHLPRFQGEMFYENMKLVKAVEDRDGLGPGPQWEEGHA
jgi:pyridoxine 4-dehydrogenase